MRIINIVTLNNILTFSKWKTDLCKCTKGSSSNEGKELNENGVCEHYCSKPYSGVRYCGTGTDYKSGDSINCQPAQGNPTKMF